MTRSELTEMIALAERLLSLGEPAVLSTLFSIQGSSYRPLGSMMVSGYGSSFMAGGVSGGCLEKYVAQEARRLMETQPSAILSFEMDSEGKDEDVPTLGCGGKIEILVERITPEHVRFLKWYQAAQETGKGSAAVSSINMQNKHKIHVHRLFGCEVKHGGVGLSQMESMCQRAGTVKRSLASSLNDSTRILVQYVAPVTRLVILGARDDAMPLCRIAREMDWQVIVADRRARLASPQRFPTADQIIGNDWWHVTNEINFTQNTAVVVMTHSFPDDVEILSLLANKKLSYLGFLGPGSRKQQLVDEVSRHVRFEPEFIQNIRGPVGLDLGERSQAGIAVSIISEILSVLNDRTTLPLSMDARLPSRESCNKLSAAYA